MAVYLPTLPTDLVRRWRHLDASMAIILSRNERQAELVAAVCEHAAQRGVQCGMSLAQARVLLSSKCCHVEAIDDARTAWSLRQIAAALLRLIPVVAVDGSDGLLCDASGCEQIYRGFKRMVQIVAKRVRRWGLSVNVAAAPTFGAAWALARYGQRDSFVAPERLLESLDPLPLAALRIEDSTLDNMRRVGLERIDQVRRVPRAAIADRYGPSVLLRLDQALGQAYEVITPVRPARRVAAERTFEGPSDRIEAVTLAAREVLAEVCAQLLVRECGCRLLELHLARSDMPVLVLTIRTAKASRDVKHLWSLLAPKLEKAQLGFGVHGVTLHAKSLARMPHIQSECWVNQSGIDDAVVGRLVDTLIARLGTDSVRTLRANESHLPERAFAHDPLLTLPEGDASAPTITDADRPTLLQQPVPIEVSLLVPNGPVATVQHGGQSYHVTSNIGPERIESEWWQHGQSIHSRDYFKVATQEGHVLWIFRCRIEHKPDAWFLHGIWA